jgi:hypothetical protein
MRFASRVPLVVGVPSMSTRALSFMSLAPFCGRCLGRRALLLVCRRMAGVAGRKQSPASSAFSPTLRTVSCEAKPQRGIATPRPFWEAGASTVQRPYALGHPPRGGCPTGRVVTRTDLRDHEADLGDHHRPICVIAMHRSPLTSKSPGGIRPGRSFGDQAAAPTPVCNALASFLQVLR